MARCSAEGGERAGIHVLLVRQNIHAEQRSGPKRLLEFSFVSTADNVQVQVTQVPTRRAGSTGRCNTTWHKSFPRRWCSRCRDDGSCLRPNGPICGTVG